MDANKQWMNKGKIGCTFASLFAKKPESVGWKTIVNPQAFYIPEDCMILSLQFEGYTEQLLNGTELKETYHKPGSFLFRSHKQFHRIKSINGRVTTFCS